MMKNKLIPKRRFKEFKNDGAWEQRKLGEIATFSKGRGYSKNDLTEVGTPIVLYGRLYTKYQTVISGVDTFAVDKPDSVYSSGNEVIVPSSGETAEDIARASAVGQSGVLLGGDLNIIYPNYDVDSAFLAMSVSNGEVQKTLTKRAQGKSVVHLHNTDLQEVELSYPSKLEQVEISRYFRDFDNLIILHQRKLKKLKETKLAYLSEMFPKEGEKYPQRRFAGFTEPWEQRKLGEIFSYKQGQQISVDNQYFEQGANMKRFIRIVDLTTNDEPERFIKYDGSNIIKPNDLFMIRYGQPGIVGYGYDGVIANNLFKFIPKIEIVNLFYKYIFECIYPALQKLSSSTTMPALNFTGLDTIIINFPKLEEQTQICTFFKNLDNLITLHQRKLEKLENIKKAYLNEMFV